MNLRYVLIYGTVNCTKSTLPPKKNVLCDESFEEDKNMRENKETLTYFNTPIIP